MKYQTEINTSHTIDSLKILLSDPPFLLPKIFKSIKDLKVNGSSYYGKAKYMGIEHELNGNVYSSFNEVSYVFTLRHGKDFGSGKLVFTLQLNKVFIVLEYEGWMERMSFSLINRWINSFLKNFEEDIRMERIIRKL